jgi:hypothetical protein
MIDDWNPFQNEENKDDNDVPILLNNDDLESFGDFQEAAVSEQPAAGQLSLDDDARETATGSSAAGTIPIDRSVETIETTNNNKEEEKEAAIISKSTEEESSSTPVLMARVDEILTQYHHGTKTSATLSSSPPSSSSSSSSFTSSVETPDLIRYTEQIIFTTSAIIEEGNSNQRHLATHDQEITNSDDNNHWHQMESPNLGEEAPHNFLKSAVVQTSPMEEYPGDTIEPSDRPSENQNQSIFMHNEQGIDHHIHNQEESKTGHFAQHSESRACFLNHWNDSKNPKLAISLNIQNRVLVF